MKLNEEFYLKRGRLPFSNNNKVIARDCIYIDPQRSETSYPVHADLKNTNAKYCKQLRTWAWFLEDADGNPLDMENVLNNEVKPGLEILKANTRWPSQDNPMNIDQTLEELRNSTLEAIDNNINGLQHVAQEENTPEAQEVRQRLIDFKRQLVQLTTMEEFENALQPVLDYGRKVKFSDFDEDAYKYSLGNLISAYIQDPEATDVKAPSDWADANRQIVGEAIPIWYTTPAGDRVHRTVQDRRAVEAEFLAQYNVDSVHDLTYAQKIRLKKELDKRVDDGRYKMTLHYDVRFTEVCEGMEDIYGNYQADRARDNNDAFKETGEASDETRFYLKIVAELCKEDDITLPQSCLAMLKNPDESPEANIGAVRDAVRAYARKQLFKLYRNKGRFYQSILQNKDRNYFNKQAEMCAWLVMKYLNYDVQSSVTLMNFWQMGQQDITSIFDSVSHVATQIYKQIKEKCSAMMFGNRAQAAGGRRRPAAPNNGVRGALGESRFIRLLETETWTGQQIAEYFNVGKQYKRQQSITENTIRNDFYEILDRLR